MPAEGFEPPTYGLQNRCTTTVLSRRRAAHIITDERYPEVAERYRRRERRAAPPYVGDRAAGFSPNRSTAAWYSLARSRKRSLARVM
jgi:hypothetical protein